MNGWKERFRRKMQVFLSGRNGTDELGRDVYIASLILFFADIFLRTKILYIIALAGVCYSTFRAFSRKLFSRQMENQKYLVFRGRIAGIPKGTFYLFYDSKEELFYEVLADALDKAGQDLRQTAKKLSNLSANEAADVLFDFMKTYAQKPLFCLLQSEEIKILESKLSKSIYEGHLKRANHVFEYCFQFLQPAQSISLTSFGVALHTVMHSMSDSYKLNNVLHKDYDDAYRMIIFGLVSQLKV